MRAIRPGTPPGDMSPETRIGVGIEDYLHSLPEFALAATTASFTSASTSASE